MSNYTQARRLREIAYNLKFIFLLALISTLGFTIYYFNNVQYPYSRAAKTSQSPSGNHYNLSLIGVPKDKSQAMTGDSGRRIFVPLYRTAKILLYEGSTFEVLDANATDGKGAFQLPNPDPDNDEVTQYSVWARALGKPGGGLAMRSCTYDALGEMWCSVYPVISVRTSGEQPFQDVSKELLYIYADLNGDGKAERYNLFNDALLGYFWNYDNNGLRLLQLRFYEAPSN